ncbi:MAG TPA: penicillin-binding protein, partial [Eggerthellaceae bacterium]|nr:penicillin-binding protein [Eggerthellaceae bacterium]
AFDEDEEASVQETPNEQDENDDSSESPNDAEDFSGFETTVEDYGERLVDPSYEKPEPNWHDGNTIQMKPVEGSEPEKSKDYLASSTKKQRSGAKGVVIAIVAIVVAAAVVALVTFQMGIWGGKTVPDVCGMTQADATSILESEGFAVRASQVKSDDTEGLVLISDPEAGAHIEEGHEVVIHIATARSIPEAVGKTQAEASALLAEEGYENVKVATQRSDEPAGTVLAIAPEPGARAKSTAEVTLTVAEPFVVPDVSNMYLDDAIATLEEAGLGYDVIYIPTEAYADGQMMGTDPVAGTEVKGGSIVYIQIAQARSTLLVNLAHSYLAPGTSVVSNGYNIVIDSLDSVTYVGNDTVSYTATGRAFTSMLSGETVYDTPTTFSGTLTFNSNNQVVG